MKVGVSILTNGTRLDYLQACISSFLENSHYRPIVVSVFDNGSTDGTKDWLANLPKYYGVEWRVQSSSSDLGCAEGTNKSIEMVRDCKYVLHLESDFLHIRQELSGEDKFWLHRAVAFMEKGECDYLYLRRMVSDDDLFQHWWPQWMDKIDREDGNYLMCNGFWWSNNPTIFKYEALLGTKTLPLDARRDGKKGTKGWSQPELQASRPPKPWIHRWGLFVHEGLKLGEIKKKECVADKMMGCKYGFFRASRGFCALCKKFTGYKEMAAHSVRFSDMFHSKA